MAELLNTVANYILQSGGIWGLLLIFAIFYIVYKEWLASKSSKSNFDIEKSSEELLEELDIIKEQHKQYSEKIENLNLKLEKICIEIASFKDINEHSDEQIKELTKQLQEVNEDRVAELKELISNYSKTMNELSLTLQKIKFVLSTKLKEK